MSSLRFMMNLPFRFAAIGGLKLKVSLPLEVGRKTFAVFARLDMQNSNERTAHPLDGAKPTIMRNLFDRVIAFLEASPSSLHANPFDEPCRCDACALSENASKISWTHPCPQSEVLDSQIPCEMIAGPRPKFFELLPVRSLQCERTAELRLSSRSAQIHHKLARHFESNLGAEIFGNQREREVHTGKDSSRGIRVAVTNKDGLRINRYVAMTACQLIGPFPMRSGTLAIEQPC